MKNETLMLGLIGNAKNGTAKTEVHYQAATGHIQLQQETGYAIASIPVKAVRGLQSDPRWVVALALYELHVGTGKIIA